MCSVVKNIRATNFVRSYFVFFVSCLSPVHVGRCFCQFLFYFHLSVCVKITAVCSFMWWLSHFCLCLLPVCVSKSIGIDCCVFFGDFWFPFCCHSFVVIVCVFSLDYASLHESPHESTSHESYASHESEGEARLWRVWWVCWRAFSSSASVEFDRAD